MMMVVLLMVAGGLGLAFFKPTLRLGDIRNTPAGLPVACPSCGSFVAAPGAAGAIVRCSECSAYNTVNADRTLAAVPADHVAQTTVFQTYLPEAPTWPIRCCLCCGEATRIEKLTLTYEADPGFDERLARSVMVGVASLGTVIVTKHVINVTERYGVPHCDQHTGGARLMHSGVAFRSYAYFREFVALNRAVIG